MMGLKRSRTAGVAAPNGPKAENSVERNLSQCESSTNVCSHTILNDRLDDLITIADLTGATLDDVVAILGFPPDPRCAFLRATLGALFDQRPPTGIKGLHIAHQRLCRAMAATPEDDDALVAPIMAIEDQLMSLRPKTISEAYRRLLALCPTLETDLTAPELAPLRAEVEAAISGEIA